MMENDGMAGDWEEWLQSKTHKDALPLEHPETMDGIEFLDLVLQQ
jgi:hypothetical protein